MSEDLILIVADSSQIDFFLDRETFSDLGVSFLTATDRKSTLWMVKTKQVAAIFLDLDVPNIQGLDVLRQLRTEGLSVPTIIISDGTCNQLPTDAFQLGVLGYLIKPLEDEAVKKAISRALSLSRLKREKANLAFRLEEQASWMQVLTEVGKSVTSSLDLDEVLKRIVEAGVDLTGAEEGFLALLDDSSGQLYLRAVKNLDGKKARPCSCRSAIHWWAR